jgi:tetratricopeptide (TPR) repeat protein
MKFRPGGLTANFLAHFRLWDRPSQIALFIAIGLLIITLLVSAFGPSELRLPTLAGAAGLFLATQIIVLWGNRGLVTPYTQAQRQYLAEDFEGARQTLEQELATHKSDLRILTLLGNTYRQLGILDKSEAILSEAINIQPDHHFPLYGFGRTLLMQGRYTEAAEAFERAISAGAPSIVHVDLGEAYYRQGSMDKARETLMNAHSIAVEAYRKLMADYILYRLGDGQPPSKEVLAEGLPYWQATADRFRQTAYGNSLAQDVHHMQRLAEGKNL